VLRRKELEEEENKEGDSNIKTEQKK